jgi:hypothetical protein
VTLPKLDGFEGKPKGIFFQKRSAGLNFFIHISGNNNPQNRQLTERYYDTIAKHRGCSGGTGTVLSVTRCVTMYWPVEILTIFFPGLLMSSQVVVHSACTFNRKCPAYCEYTRPAG